MIKIKRFGFFFTVLVTLACIYTTSSSAAVPINFGEQAIFTEFNFNESYFFPDPVNTIPPYEAPTRASSSVNGVANSSVTAVQGQAGMAGANTGIEFSLNYGSMNWEDVKSTPVLVTIEFSYELNAIYTLGRGSANAFATYNLYNNNGWPAYDNIGYETSSSGTKSNSVKAEIWTTYGDLNDKYFNKIFITCLSQAHVVFNGGVTHSSFSNLKLDRITLSPYVPEPIQISIDIKPGSYPNSIYPTNVGNIPVAIISTPEFHALQMINPNSLTFGPTGDEQSLAFCNAKGEDINADGILDLVCHFITLNTHFECGDKAGILRGETTDGTPLEGVDSVRIVPCK